MKNTTLSFVIAMSMAIGLFTSCEPTNKESAEENVQSAKEELKDAKQELKEERVEERQDDAFLQDKLQFQTENSDRIRRNEEKIAELKAKVDKSDQTKQQRIAELEQKNRDLKTRLDEPHDNKAREKWDEFKREFNHDMDELGAAIKGIFQDDKK